MRLSRLEADLARKASCFIFRVSESFAHDIAGPRHEHARNSVLWRANHKPILMLTYSVARGAHELLRVQPGGLVAVADGTGIRDIMQSDLHDIVISAAHECYLEASPTYHFVTPSNRHTSRFLRVGDAIRSMDILDRLAFWLLPVVAKADGILVDHWSIAPAVMSALLQLGLRLPFECLSEHPRVNRVVAVTALDKVLRASLGARIRCIVSVTASGSLSSLLREVFAERGVGVDTDTVTSLYGFAGSGQEVMCELDDKIENYGSEEECEFCNRGSTAVQVDPRVYYVRSFKETEVALKTDHLVIGSEFLESSPAAVKSLRIHRNDPNDGRHHAFDIDVATLLADEAFLRRFEQRLHEVGRVEVVVTPNHHTGRQMAGIAAAVHGGIPVIVHNDLRFNSSLDAAQLALLKESKRVLFVDDVLNSGNRLNQFNIALREGFGQFESVMFLVGIARAESAEEYAENRIALTRNHPWKATLAYIDCIQLPRWNQRLCPWCQEYDFLTGISEKLAEPPIWLLDRIGSLSERERGMLEEPLLILPGVSHRNALGAGSPVGREGLSAMGAMFVLAAGMQALRNDEDRSKRLDVRFPDARVFAIRNLKNFSEGLLRALLLRLVRRQEWGDAKKSQLRKKLYECAASPNQEVILGELMLASARGSIPPIGRQFFAARYGALLGESTGAFSDALHL